MSVDLDIRLTRSVKIDALMTLAGATLRTILAVPDIPPLYVAQLEAGKRHLPTTDVIDHKGQVFLIGLENCEEEVSIVRASRSLIRCTPAILPVRTARSKGGMRSDCL